MSGIPGHLPNFGYVSDKLAGSGMPSDLKAAKDQGFTAVLNLTDKEPSDVLDLTTLATRPLGYKRIPLNGEGLATVDDLQKATEFIEKETAPTNGKVLVHCFRGQYRTGIVLAAALLQASKNYTKENVQAVIDEVNTKRGNISITEQQKDILLKFAEEQAKKQ